MDYEAKYGHDGDSSIPGALTLKATDDASAQREVDEFVAQGVRNGTWAAVRLSTGERYQANNEHGEAVGFVSAYG